jgi:tRNA-dihydrouridine synthase B
MIYLAPIQGFTDFVYRKAYATIFTHIDAYFIPYISVKNNEILNKYKKEILPQNNLQEKVIPQVLAKDAAELLFLSSILKDLGYREINLNLGCPYPMVTNRNKGAGLLPQPEIIKSMLSAFFEKENIKLSVKLRAGLNSPTEIEELIPILNEFPLTETILHPRIAKQLYAGDIYNLAFQFAQKNIDHNLVYNGDIFTLSDFKDNQQQFPEINRWMLGRGILTNPFLPSEMNKVTFSENEKIEKLQQFHQLIFEGYTENMDNTGNVLNKMIQFWSYFSFNFPNQKKIFKAIKKSKNITTYNQAIKKAFFTLY